VEFILAAAGFIVALGMLATAIGVIAKSQYLGRPLRWLWATNVSGPIGRWFEARVEGVVGQHVEYLMHHRNNGSSLLDLKESLQEAREDINLLLRHDAERDTKGHRYGPDPKEEP
jgi:hypothetical protein